MLQLEHQGQATAAGRVSQVRVDNEIRSDHQVSRPTTFTLGEPQVATLLEQAGRSVLIFEEMAADKHCAISVGPLGRIVGIGSSSEEARADLIKRIAIEEEDTPSDRLASWRSAFK